MSNIIISIADLELNLLEKIIYEIRIYKKRFLYNNLTFTPLFYSSKDILSALKIACIQNRIKSIP
jgi:hypothetical protein